MYQKYQNDKGVGRKSVVEEIALLHTAPYSPDHLGIELKTWAANSRASYYVHGPAAGNDKQKTPGLVKENDHYMSKEQRKTLTIILEQERADRNAKLAGGKSSGKRPKYKRGETPRVHAEPWNHSVGLGPNGLEVVRARWAADSTCGEDGVHKPSKVREPPFSARKYPSFMPGIAPWSEAADPPLPDCGPQVSIPLLKRRKAPTDTGLGRRLPDRPASCPPGALASGKDSKNEKGKKLSVSFMAR